MKTKEARKLITDLMNRIAATTTAYRKGTTIIKADAEIVKQAAEFLGVTPPIVLDYEYYHQK